MKTKKKSTKKDPISKSSQSELTDIHEEMLRFTKYAIEHSGEMAFWMNSKGQLIFVNDTACNVYGYTKEELLNMTIFEIGHAISKKNWKNTWQKIKQNKNYTFQTLHYKKNRKVIPVEVTINFIEYEGEEYNCAFVRDISQRIQAEAVLERAKIIDQIHDAVIGTDLNGVITLWNKGAERQFGYTSDEIIGKLIYMLYPEDKHTFTSDDVIRLLKDEHKADIEITMKRKSGETLYAHSSLSDIVDNDGNITGIVSYTIDITERKLAENELEKYRNQLEHLVRKRTQELELAQSSLIRKNRNLNVLSECNKKLVHASDEQQLLDDICHIIVDIGKYRLTWVGFAENDEYKTIRPVAQCGYEAGYLENLNISWADTEFGHGPVGTSVRTSEIVIARDIKNDPDFKPWREAAIERGYASVVSFPLLDDDKPFGAIAIYAEEADAFDKAEIEILTELADNLAYGIKAHRTRNELLKKERLAVLGQLIATVSHELRNPLGSIRSSLYTIENKTSAHDLDIEKPIKRIERNIYRCDNIIDELLDYTRIRDLSLLTTNINAWLTIILDEYTFPDTVTVTQKFDTDIVVEIEQERFRRCLINILNNACQAMVKNTEPANQHILVETKIDNNKLNIRITDTGQGITTAELNKIFEPLYSTKVYGVGLGLPIVKQIMRLHGGDVEISSEKGHGTTVLLWLPL